MEKFYDKQAAIEAIRLHEAPTDDTRLTPFSLAVCFLLGHTSEEPSLEAAVGELDMIIPETIEEELEGVRQIDDFSRQLGEPLTDQPLDFSPRPPEEA